MAIVCVHSSPEPELLEISSGTLKSCTSGDLNNLTVINVKSIESVISMSPFQHGEELRLTSGEKPGLAIGSLGGIEECMENV